MVFRKVYYVRLSASTVAMCLGQQYSIEYVYVRARARNGQRCDTRRVQYTVSMYSEDVAVEQVPVSQERRDEHMIMRTISSYRDYASGS